MCSQLIAGVSSRAKWDDKTGTNEKGLVTNFERSKNEGLNTGKTKWGDNNFLLLLT